MAVPYQKHCQRQEGESRRHSVNRRWHGVPPLGGCASPDRAEAGIEPVPKSERRMTETEGIAKSELRKAFSVIPALRFSFRLRISFIWDSSFVSVYGPDACAKEAETAAAQDA